MKDILTAANRFRVGALLFACSFYVMADPTGAFVAWPVLKTLAAGMFMASLFMGITEAGLQIGLKGKGSTVDWVFCLLFIMTAVGLLYGFGKGAGRQALFMLPQLLIGGVSYWVLLRTPALVLLPQLRSTP